MSAAAESDERGFVVLRGFESPERRARLRAIGDRVLEAMLADREGAETFENGPNIAFLTDAAHHSEHEEELCELLEWVADPRILSIVTEAGGGAALFHNTQYFFEPRRHSWSGSWHRDTRFMAPDLGLFHAWMIHRGTYVRERPCRTLDIIYGCGELVPWAEPEARCLPRDSLRERLSVGASEFYRDTLAAKPGEVRGATT